MPRGFFSKWGRKMCPPPTPLPRARGISVFACWMREPLAPGGAAAVREVADTQGQLGLPRHSTTAGFKRQLLSSDPGARKCESKVPAEVGSSRGLSDRLLCASPDAASPGKAPGPAGPHMTITSPKAPPANAVMLGVRAAHVRSPTMREPASSSFWSPLSPPGPFHSSEHLYKMPGSYHRAGPRGQTDRGLFPFGLRR